MQRLRFAVIRKHRAWFGLLLLVALLAKAVIPAGFMVTQSDTLTLAITVCSETTGEMTSRQLVVPVHKESKTGDGPRHDATCAFADLAKASLGGADPLLLALALAFILLLGVRTTPALRPVAAHYLRPPLRGPPLSA